MLAVVAPGQGSQTPGFLAPWFEFFDAQGDFSAKLVAGWSELCGLDLRHLGSTADADEIRDTAKAQPLLFLGGLTGVGALFAGDASSISVVAGHSVGEVTAAAFAGVLSPSDALTLVTARGREMAKAASGSNSGMSAVLGGDRDLVVAHLASLGLTAANENGAGQIVAAGSLDALAQLSENAPEGSRIRPLAVSGAFHTSVMEPAVSAINSLATGLTVSDPTTTILSNKDGAKVASGREVIDRIVGQIAGPVRWDLCMQTLSDMGVTGVIEVPPAGTLTGLIKRAQPQIATFALKTPDDLDAARAFVAEHGSAQ
ncbi:MAG: ACP S-malonyltransferase [Actinomycetes bacterium]